MFSAYVVVTVLAAAANIFLTSRSRSLWPRQACRTRGLQQKNASVFLALLLLYLMQRVLHNRRHGRIVGGKFSWPKKRRLAAVNARNLGDLFAFG